MDFWFLITSVGTITYWLELGWCPRSPIGMLSIWFEQLNISNYINCLSFLPPYQIRTHAFLIKWKWVLMQVHTMVQDWRFQYVQKTSSASSVCSLLMAFVWCLALLCFSMISQLPLLCIFICLSRCRKRNKCMQEYSCFPRLSVILDIYMQEYLHLAH